MFSCRYGLKRCSTPKKARIENGVGSLNISGIRPLTFNETVENVDVSNNETLQMDLDITTADTSITGNAEKVISDETELERKRRMKKLKKKQQKKKSENNNEVII